MLAEPLVNPEGLSVTVGHKKLWTPIDDENKGGILCCFFSKYFDCQGFGLDKTKVRDGLRDELIGKIVGLTV